MQLQISTLPKSTNSAEWSEKPQWVTRRWVFHFGKRAQLCRRFIQHPGRSQPHCWFPSTVLAGDVGPQHLLEPAWGWGSCSNNCSAFHTVLGVVFPWENPRDSSWSWIIQFPSFTLGLCIRFFEAMEIHSWQLKETLLCLFYCKHRKRGCLTYSIGLLGWINRCF